MTANVEVFAIIYRLFHVKGLSVGMSALENDCVHSEHGTLFGFAGEEFLAPIRTRHNVAHLGFPLGQICCEVHLFPTDNLKRRRGGNGIKFSLARSILFNFGPQIKKGDSFCRKRYEITNNKLEERK